MANFLSFEATFRVLDEMLGNVNQITSDKEQAYHKYTTVRNIKHINVKARTVEAKALNDIDTLHYNCRKFFRKFYDVSYHYISCYITWFKFFKVTGSDSSIQKTTLLGKLLIF